MNILTSILPLRFPTAHFLREYYCQQYVVREHRFTGPDHDDDMAKKPSKRRNKESTTVHNRKQTLTTLACEQGRIGLSGYRETFRWADVFMGCTTAVIIYY